MCIYLELLKIGQHYGENQRERYIFDKGDRPTYLIFFVYDLQNNCIVDNLKLRNIADILRKYCSLYHKQTFVEGHLIAT